MAVMAQLRFGGHRKSVITLRMGKWRGRKGQIKGWEHKVNYTKKVREEAQKQFPFIFSGPLYCCETAEYCHVSVRVLGYKDSPDQYGVLTTMD